MTHPDARCSVCGVSRADRPLYGSLSQPDLCGDCLVNEIHKQGQRSQSQTGQRAWKMTYRTLQKLLAKMTENQKDSDVTVEIPHNLADGCYPVELRFAGEDHDGGLDANHPVLYVHDPEHDSEQPVRRDDIEQIIKDTGMLD